MFIIAYHRQPAGQKKIFMQGDLNKVRRILYGPGQLRNQVFHCRLTANRSKRRTWFG